MIGKTSSRMIGMLLSALLVASPVIARHPEYHHKALLGSGYREKRLSVSSWQVTTFSVNQAAMPLAVYRAALILKKAGYPFMQFVKSEMGVQVIPIRAEGASLIVNGVASRDTPIICRNKKRYPCQTLEIDAAMHEAAGELGESPTEIVEDYALVTLQPVK